MYREGYSSKNTVKEKVKEHNGRKANPEGLLFTCVIA